MTFFALYALQHRGQESAGIVTCDGTSATVHKGMGLVSQVFNEANLAPLQGHLAVGHTRYSTTGSSHPKNAQPHVIETIYGPLGVAHNGNLVNTRELRRALLERGVGLSTGSDSEVITQILAAPPEVWTNGKGAAPAEEPEADRWLRAIRALMRVARGAYSLALLTRKAIYAVRDPHGIRPLCVGEVDTGWVVASESCALETIGARFVRDVEPGEIIKIDKRGITSYEGVQAERPAFCVFEYVYLARPDSVLEGQGVHEVRRRLGQELAREAPAEVDIVVGVPDSAISAAIGYSEESGIPYAEGLIKNRYIGRTFIQPDDELRKVGVGLKYNPLRSTLEGKRVVVVDDSIVRGNTAGPLVELLRSGGAREVHVRVASPPVRHPCFMGVDMATRDQLIAHRMDLESIRKRIGADSLAYLSHDGLLKAVADGLDDRRGRCTACFSGHYPIAIPEHLFSQDAEKEVLEQVWLPQKSGVS